MKLFVIRIELFEARRVKEPIPIECFERTASKDSFTLFKSKKKQLSVPFKLFEARGVKEPVVYS